MSKTERIAECTSIEDILIFVSSKLSEAKVPRPISYQSLLISEETMSVVLNQVKPDKVVVRYSNSFGSSSFKFIYKGPIPYELSLEDSEHDNLSSRILNYYSQNLKIQYHNGYTTITVLQHQSMHSYSRKLLIAIVLAVLSSLLMMAVMSESQITWFEDYLLWPVSGIIVNALELIATPATFMCILVNVATSVKLIDRFPTVKIVQLRYMITSVVSIGLGYLAYLAFAPLLSGIYYSNETILPAVEAEGLSLQKVWETISNIVPDNFFAPFLDYKILQLIFIAILCGIAVGLVDRETGRVKDSVDIIRNLFCKMLSVMFHFSPFLLFLFLMELMLYEGPMAIIYELIIIAVILIGLVLLGVLYVVELLIAGENPIDFFKKMKQCLVETFKTGSSLDSVPKTIKYCEKELNFPHKPVEVSVNLGAMINMDAATLVETIFVLVFCNASKVELNASLLLLIFVLVFGVSYGTTNQPGALTVGAMVILPAIGLDMAFITSVIFIEVLTNSLVAMFDVMGDIVTVKIVGDREKRLTKRGYNKFL